MRWRLETRPANRPTGRILAFCLLVIFGGLLVVAVALEPDPAGVGTHRQLPAGIGASWYSRPPPCSMIMIFGIPCPTCGMTTAFAHVVRGQIIRAFLVQPAGAVLALGSMITVMLSLYTLLTGRVVRWSGVRIRPVWVALGCVGALLPAWVYKIVIMRG